MNDHHSAWPLFLSWAGNGLAFVFSHTVTGLQVISLLVTIGYTLHRWRLLKRDKSE